MSGGLGLALVSVVGLAIGIWLGLPGRDRPTPEDVERAMNSPSGRPARRRRAKRSINPLAWVQRKAKAPPSRGRGFKIESPEDR